MTITVLLVDDHAVVRSGLSKFLMVNKDLKLVGEASDGAEAVQLVSLYKPDVVLMDLMMPGTDGITATREIFGIISLRSSIRFPLNSGAKLDNPVILPPGRARVATNPLPTGSISWVMTIGMLAVACLAAWVGDEPPVTMTSTLRATSSAAS